MKKTRKWQGNGTIAPSKFLVLQFNVFGSLFRLNFISSFRGNRFGKLQLKYLFKNMGNLDFIE